MNNIAFPIIDALPLSPELLPLPFRDTYSINGPHYDVVISIGDYAIDTMLAEMVVALTAMGFLDPPLI